jgi:hypothetical protein
MSESIQKLLLLFGVAMVVLIGLLLALQVAFGSIADEEPEMVNPQSLAVAALFAFGFALVFGTGIDGGGGDRS